MPMMKGGRVFAEAMKAEGVPAMYGVPGHAYLGLVDALVDLPEIKYVLFRHEEAASIAAGVHSRLIGFRPVMAAGTCGPGVAHLINGAYGALQEGWPIILLGGQIETRFLMKGGLQEAPHVEYLRPITKWAIRVEMALKIPEIVRNAVKTATSGIPGPVYIDFPLDMQFEQMEMENYIPSTRLLSFGDPVRIKTITDILTSSERPVILAGSGCVYDLASKELSELAQTLGAPVVTTPMAKGIVPDVWPLYGGLFGSGEAKKILSAADMILLAGVAEREFGGEPLLNEYSAKLVEVNVQANDVGTKGAVIQGVVGNVNMVLGQIMDMLKMMIKGERNPPSILAEVRRMEKEAEVKMAEDVIPMHPAIAIKGIGRILADDGIATSEAGQIGDFALRYIKAKNPNTLVKPNWPSATGTALPAAIGVKLAFRDRQVIAICGDSGFVSTLRDFEVATRERLGITFCILNNNELGAQRLKQEERFGRSIPMNTIPFDYLKFGESFHVFSSRVKKPSELAPTLQSAIRASGEGLPSIVEIPVKTVKE